jgi:hypothetical protein
MVLLYYFLSKDEERRMLKDHPETYRDYMEKTGMFFPKKIEGRFAPSSAIRLRKTQLPHLSPERLSAYERRIIFSCMCPWSGPEK